MSTGMKIKIKGGSGQADEVVIAAAVSGGVGNSLPAAMPSEGIKTDLSSAEFDIEGPSGTNKKVKILGVVEGGIANDVRANTSDGVKSADDEQGHYKMDAEPRGYCYIFNNKEFEESQWRFGSDKDKEAIAKVFSNLKFKVKTFDNSEADVMETRLKKLSKMDHNPFNCLVVIFLTHGRDGEVQGSDNDWLKLSTITSYFQCHNCKSLAEKPKLFFFQSCRGSNFQKGHKVKADGDDDAEEEVTEWTEKEEEKLVAPEADFFYGYATVSGKQAMRNVESGGWYIQELAEVLRQRADKDDLLSMMTTVKRRVNTRQAECASGVIKQTAETTSTLLKKLHFLPQNELKSAK